MDFINLFFGFVIGAVAGYVFGVYNKEITDFYNSIKMKNNEEKPKKCRVH